MANFLLGMAIGLVVGWNLLPQPKFVKEIWGIIMAMFQGKNNENNQ